MLGRLQMTVQQAKDIYCHVSGKIFGKMKGHATEGKFSATELEKIMRKMIEEFGEPKGVNHKADPEMKLLETQAATTSVKCKAFTSSSLLARVN